MIQPENGILPADEKEELLMDTPPGKPDTETIHCNLEQWLLVGRGTGRLSGKGRERTFWGNRMFCVLIGVGVAWVHAFVKIR